jgi:hypothetical protein
MIKYIRFAGHLLILLLTLIALAACGSDSSSIPEASTDMEVTYRREGGIAGITQEWTIFADGRIVGPRDQEMQVAAEEVILLLAKLKDLESIPVQESYVGEDACCDLFIYTITFKVDDQTTTVQTIDGADHPEEVSLLLANIEDLIAQAEPIETQ